MSPFQILGIGFTGLLALAVAIGGWRRRLAPGPALLWVLLFTAAAAAIARPSLTVLAADALGIDRGADLVFYCAILAMFAGFLLIYVRIRRIEGHITILARHIAISAAGGTEDVEARKDDAGV